jgi:hypothetical protein
MLGGASCVAEKY